jgi:hypothetical protein
MGEKSVMVAIPEYGGDTMTEIPEAGSSVPSFGSSFGGGLMFASMGLSAIGAITSAFMESSAIKAQGAYEKSISDTNAAIASLQSTETLQAGQVATARRISQTQQQVGTQRAVTGASGTDVAGASAVLGRLTTENVGGIDALTIKNNAQRQAFGYQAQGIQATAAGQFAELTARARATQSLLMGGLQALEGPLAIESRYMLYQKYLGRTMATGGYSGTPFPNVTE